MSSESFPLVLPEPPHPVRQLRQRLRALRLTALMPLPELPASLTNEYRRAATGLAAAPSRDPA
jgi:hypothetical protein